MKQPNPVLITDDNNTMDEYEQDELNRKFMEIVAQVPQEAAMLRLISIENTHFILLYYKSMHWWGYWNKHDSKAVEGGIARGVNMCHDRQLAWVSYTGLIEKWCQANVMSKCNCWEGT